MRFPWLQVDADFIGAHASDLGARLGISRREAMGLALDLWTWALARARDDAPPDGMVTGTGAEPDRLLAGSVCWTGPAEVLSAALVASGLAVRIDDGYRLTGFDRYKATWEKNRRRTGGKPERNRTGTGEEPARKTQTQTQTQTQRKTKDDPPNPPGGEGSRHVPVVRQDAAPAPYPEQAPEPHDEPTSAWTLPDAIDAVHREVMEGRPYRWDTVHDEKAATVLMSLCAAEGIPISDLPEEAGRRFGRALVRSLWRFERAAGKAVTLRELARRECWNINADPPRREEEARGDLSGVAERREVAIEPWDAMIAKREAA